MPSTKSHTPQIISRQRVADHGEVFTAEREVKAMCDLVKTETERIDSRFLEPACGDGNFLAEILSRKLAVVKKKYKKFPMDYAIRMGTPCRDCRIESLRNRHSGRQRDALPQSSLRYVPDSIPGSFPEEHEALLLPCGALSACDQHSVG